MRDPATDIVRVPLKEFVRAIVADLQELAAQSEAEGTSLRIQDIRVEIAFAFETFAKNQASVAIEASQLQHLAPEKLSRLSISLDQTE